MAVIKWKIKQLLCRLKAKWKYIIGIVLLIIFFRNYGCWKLGFLDLVGQEENRYMCSEFTGGLANQMFQYAYGYTLLKHHNGNLRFIIDNDNILTKVFNIKPNPFENYGYTYSLCKCFKKYHDKLDCGYDETFEGKLSQSRHSYLYGYFQSWKYFIEYENEIRNHFRFQNHIVWEADQQLRQILVMRNATVKDGTTLVGVHIRNGDYSQPYYKKFGYKIPPPTYLKNAMKYFKKRFKKIIFLVCTNDIRWTNRVLSGERNYYIVRGNPAEVDMALLSMTNHTIMTVGTFGWMIGFLTKGITVHYKYPFIEGTGYAAQFHANYSDHFYPGWIALE